MRSHGHPRTFAVLAGLAAVVATTAAMMAPRSDREITIPAGTKLVANLTTEISTETTQVGDWVQAKTTNALHVGSTVIPAGMVLKGEIVKSKGGGRVTGKPELAIRFQRLATMGGEYAITADTFRVYGKSETKKSAKRAIGGAIVGGVVGAVTGNTKRGVLIGAVVGTGVAVATKGGHIALAEGQSIEVRLAKPVIVVYRSDIALYPPR